jgi:SAM-dependent methyltransferase
LSVSFDRAAGYYDQTRSLPDELMDVLVARIVAELPPDGRCLEIGVGTGRIALPLMRRGVDVTGVDISMEMLRRLREKSRSGAVKIAIADATRLPFADGNFAGAVAAHVLHLIPGWRMALDELQRVLRPGGVLLASRAGGTRSEWQRAVRRHFYVEAGDPSWPPGIDTIELLDDEMRSRGAAVREVEDVIVEGTATISGLLAALENGIWSACWSIDEATRDRRPRRAQADVAPLGLASVRAALDRASPEPALGWRG